MNIKQKLRDFILNRLFDAEDGLTDDEELLESGILDSMALVQLAGHMESTYGIQVEVGEMDEERFGTLNRMEQFVNSRLKQVNIAVTV